jgi:uncharacterized protein YecT (DUF1311 family)
MKVAIVLVFLLLGLVPIFTPQESASKADDANALLSLSEIKAQRMPLQQNLDDKINRFTKGLDDEGNALFSQSQVAWDVYAQKHCMVEGDLYRDGSLSSTLQENCYNEALKKRTAEVELLMKAYQAP